MAQGMSYDEFMTFFRREIVDIDDFDLMENLYNTANKYVGPIFERLKSGEDPVKLMDSLEGSGMEVALANDYEKVSNEKQATQADNSSFFDDVLFSVGAAIVIVGGTALAIAAAPAIGAFLAAAAAAIMATTAFEIVAAAAILIPLYLLLKTMAR